ncbi:hypothetical protein WN48_04046 [Eufriesea mexicana]|uniref:Uncharacterized protein n=1 Tax=Eufriesea mexicana TaxID=516756 RepID=A0A310SLY9_9HYME|nr:hypothetical protein WN48_04046 [Eufriesea mexicana]
MDRGGASELNGKLYYGCFKAPIRKKVAENVQLFSTKLRVNSFNFMNILGTPYRLRSTKTQKTILAPPRTAHRSQSKKHLRKHEVSNTSQHPFFPKSQHSPGVLRILPILTSSSLYEIHSWIDEHDVQFVLPLPVAPMDFDDLLWMPPSFMADDVNYASWVRCRHGSPMLDSPQTKDHERDQAHPKRATTHITRRYCYAVNHRGFYKLQPYQNSEITAPIGSLGKCFENSAHDFGETGIHRSWSIDDVNDGIELQWMENHLI